MILVLLTRFCESGDSVVGYQLCQALAKQGHDLYVTTISTGKKLEAEMKNAEEVNMSEKGNVTLLNPDFYGDEQPDSKWIVKNHGKYFGYL